jgi:GAF domain-containing protein
MPDKPEIRFNEDEILNRIRKIAKDYENIIEKTVDTLKEIPNYDWVGIYLVEDDYLVLRYFSGKPTVHTKIKIREGICSAAVLDKKTVIVPDVSVDERYIACSIETQSEIVVPIWSADKVIGEIDIDSDSPDVFDSLDKHMLEMVARILGDLI